MVPGNVASGKSTVARDLAQRSRLMYRSLALQLSEQVLPDEPAAFQAGGVIMVGRDIASVVLPDAPLKIFPIADLDERAVIGISRKRAAASLSSAFARIWLSATTST